MQKPAEKTAMNQSLFVFSLGCLASYVVLVNSFNQLKKKLKKKILMVLGEIFTWIYTYVHACFTTFPQQEEKYALGDIYV